MGCFQSQSQAVQYVDDPASTLIKKRAESPVAQVNQQKMHQTEHIANLQVNTPQLDDSVYKNTPLANDFALSLSSADGGLAASPLREIESEVRPEDCREVGLQAM